MSLAIAAAACGGPQPPVATDQQSATRSVAAIDPAPSAGTTTPGSGSDWGIVDSSPRQPVASTKAAPPPPPSTASSPIVPTRDAESTCAEYARRTKVDTSKARDLPHNRADILPHSSEQRIVGRLRGAEVECTIERARERTFVEELVTPVCCPAPPLPRAPGQTGPTEPPCPPPRKEKLPAERVIREHVVLNERGVATRQELIRATVVERRAQPACGRRPEGFALGEAACTSAGAKLAAMAELEEASIAAFDRLARELEAHGAPCALVEAASRAKADEVRHARVMARHARRLGGAPRPVDERVLGVRSLYEVALENAVEGCVHETYGAIAATFQAARARDTALRASLRRIARDERGHAELAAAVHVWAMSRLPAEEAESIEQARALAADGLADTLREGDDEDPALGLPSPQDALRAWAAFTQATRAA